jgi:hypothetical protein
MVEFVSDGQWQINDAEVTKPSEKPERQFECTSVELN